jgi:flavin-binding protein dodecin
MNVRAVIVAAAVLSSAASVLVAQAPNEVPYAATRLIGRWRTVMNRALEDARASAAESVTDRMEEFVSPGAVRAVQDKASEEQLKRADDALERLVYAMVKAGTRQQDGSVIVEEAALDPARRAICPVYPFCERQ